jgi:hypothetical protein
MRLMPVAVLLATVGLGLPALAESPSAPQPAAAPTKKEAVVAPTVDLEAVLRGLFFEARVGGGYAVFGQNIKVDPNFPAVKGSEKLGGGVLVNMGLGYELTRSFALQLAGGATLISGHNSGRVRDLGIVYGGAAVRFASELGSRFDFVGSLGAGYASANNSVEKAESGPAVFASGGVEYFVHVRHFALGADLFVLVPVQPARAFIGIGPRVKYTF